MQRLRVPVTFLLAAYVVTAATTPKPPGLRLNPDVFPTLYKAALVVTPGKPSFTGSITIELDVRKSSDQIWLNTEVLTLSSAYLSIGARKITPRLVRNGKDLTGFLFDYPIPKGAASLEIHYTGTVMDKPGPGLSHSIRNQSDYVVTHFEPIAARRVFPCFDEPDFKAPWQLTIDAPAKDMVVSNAAIRSEAVENGRRRVTFNQTKPLPTYLIALTIGEYEAVDVGKVGRNHTPVRIIVPKGDRAKAGFAAKIVPKIVEQLESYFDIAYPYEKLDQVAVPNYPENSAMEDAGSILYDDSMILCAPERLTHSMERYILWLIIHETTHQWFGDLVTLAWWDDAWLNEGFTEWLQWKIQKQWGSDWRDDLDALDDLERVMHQDVRSVAHPVRQRIDSPGQIETEFDDITYFKTAEVLQMIERYVGEETVKNCIRRYLRAHLFGNATSRDFSNELAKVNPAANISFEQFLNRKGFPEVSVALDCSKAKPVVHLRQEIFRPLSVEAGQNDPWTFPFCMRYSNGKAVTDTCTLLKDPTFDVSLSRAGCPAWLIANADASGYYTTRYDAASFEKLSRNVHSLSPLDRLHTVWEIGFLVSAGREQPIRLLEAIRHLGPFTTAPDLLAALQFSAPLLRYETSDKTIGQLTAYFESTFGEAARKLGWTPPVRSTPKEREDHLGAVSSIAILGEDPQLIGTARQLAADWLRDRNSVPADVVGPALVVAGRFATPEFYTKLLKAAKEETDHDKRLKAVNGLGFVRDPALIKQSFALFVAGTFPLSESRILLAGPAGAQFHTLPQTRRMPLEFIRDHTTQVRAIFPTPLGRDYSLFFAHTASPLCTADDLKLAGVALSPILHPSEGGDQRLAEALEAIKLCTTAREATQSGFEKNPPVPVGGGR